MAKSRFNTSSLILEIIKANPLLSSKDIHTKLDAEIGYATLKRILQKLISENLIQPTGQGKGTKYQLGQIYELIRPIDVEVYFQKEIDEREIKERFNYSLIPEVLNNVSVFTNDELNQLNDLQKIYSENISKLTDSEYKKELERWAIDMSWKSSQIEGNTYSLLETERLLKEKETASGKTKDEAIMLLNHKDALDFILQNPN
jgi:predicted transcriptional regulator